MIDFFNLVYLCRNLLQKDVILDVLDIDTSDSLVYIIITTSLEMIKFIFTSLYEHKYNTRNVILMTHPCNKLDGLLEIAWSDYKMLNVYNFEISRKNPEGLTINILFYDPFIRHQDPKQGIYKISISKNNTDDELIINSQKIFRERILDLHQYPIRIGVIHFPGYLEIVKDGNVIRYTKVYGNIINAIIHHMNFAPMSIIPKDVTAYGGRLENGSVVGLIGLLERDEVEFAANIKVFERNLLENAVFSSILSETSYCFITPNKQATLKSTFTSIVGRRTYSGLTITCIITVLLKYAHHRLHSQNSEGHSQRFDFFIKILELLAYFLVVSYKVPKIRFHRLLFIILIFMAMVVNFTYQGNMIKILTLETKSSNLKTLTDLANSDLNIYTTIGAGSYNPFRLLGDEVNDKLQNRMFKVTEYEEGMDKVIRDKDSAFLVLRSFIDVYGSKWYSNETGASTVNVIYDGDNMNNFLAILITKHSPYLGRVNSLVKRIREGGLYDKIYEDSVFKSKLNLLRMPKAPNKTNFSMEELLDIFIMLAAALSACTAIFVLEIIYKQVIDKNKTFSTQ